MSQNPNHITVDFDGDPAPQPRAKARVINAKSGKAFVHMYTPKGSKGWKERISAAVLPLKPAEPWTGPVRIVVRMFMERPQYLNKKSSPECEIPKNTKPDGDNYEKALFDALVDAGVMKDDGQVWCCLWVKCWCAKGYAPGTQLDIFHDVDQAGALKALEQINQLARGVTHMPGEKSGKANPMCVSCMGAGHMEGVKGNCPACKGTGIEKV